VNIVELRELSVEELDNRVETLRREIYNLKFKGVVEQIEDNSIFTKNRREIAQAKTVMAEKSRKTKEEA
jgi:large subunit ribosomal protein L29